MLEMAVSPRTAYPVAYTPFKDKAKDGDANADVARTGVSLPYTKIGRPGDNPLSH